MKGRWQFLKRIVMIGLSESVNFDKNLMEVTMLSKEYLRQGCDRQR